MHNMSKYKLPFLLISFLFLPLSFVGAIGYGVGSYNAGLYSATLPNNLTASPAAASYNVTQSVTLTASNTSFIRHSSFEIPSNCSADNLYSGPISISSSQTIYVRACDNYGNSATSSFTYVIDSNIPAISSVTSSEDPIVSWTTDKLTSSVVDYGLTTDYGSSTVEINTSPRVTTHSVSISNLARCTTYHYRVRSKDAALNEGVSSDQTFTTSGCTASSTRLDNVSGQIDKTTGGIVKTSNDSLIVNIPSAFASSSANFQIHKLDKATVILETSVPAGYLSASNNVYELKSLIDNETIVSSFLSPITITMSYEVNDLVGINESSLKIYRWDGSLWHQLTGCSINTSAKTVSCSTNNFSVFSIFGTANQAFNNSMPNSWLLPPSVPVGGFKLISNSLTDKQNIELSFIAGSDTVRVAISNYSDFRNATIENYTNNKAWDICSGLTSCNYGPYNVYVKFYTQHGVSSDVVTTTVNYQPKQNSVLDISTPVIRKIDKILTNKLKGRILLQVESRGEAWYVNPKDGKRHYMADGNKAYDIMRYLSVGITNNDLSRLQNDKNLAKKNSGKIFLQVESLGEAYYFDVKGVGRYLKDGGAAYEIMRNLGLGITNENLNKIAE